MFFLVSCQKIRMRVGVPNYWRYSYIFYTIHPYILLFMLDVTLTFLLVTRCPGCTINTINCVLHSWHYDLELIAVGVKSALSLHRWHSGGFLNKPCRLYFTISKNHFRTSDSECCVHHQCLCGMVHFASLSIYRVVSVIQLDRQYHPTLNHWCWREFNIGVC
jgi:hypothetical protein